MASGWYKIEGEFPDFSSISISDIFFGTDLQNISFDLLFWIVDDNDEY